jgi:cytoskeletal protein CcmA (bactofilin family)
MHTFTLIILFFSYAVFADESSGICVYGNETVESVVCYGPTVMKQTIVKGDVKVVGTLRAENISAQHLQVEGAAELKNSLINQSTKVTGSLSADNVEFKQGIAIESDSVLLNQSKVNGMVTITSPIKTPYLQVQCGTVITGAILFDGKAGIIQLTGDSLIKQDKVSNGAMQRVQSNCKN